MVNVLIQQDPVNSQSMANVIIQQDESQLPVNG